MDAMVSSKGQEDQEFEDPAAVTQSTADLTVFVQNLLQQMQSRFQTMSDSILSKNEMGTRIDDLEKSIGDLMKEVTVEPENAHLDNQPSDFSKNSLASALDD